MSGCLPIAKIIKEPSIQLVSLESEKVKALVSERRGRERLADQRREERRKEQKERVRELSERRKIAEFQKLQTTCLGYGFKTETEGMANCILQLKVLEEQKSLQQQNAAQSALARREYEQAVEDIRAEEERQRSSEALINLGSALLSGPSNSPSSSSSSSTPSQSLNTNRFKTCSYRVGADVVPLTLDKAAICPTSNMFGGKTGYLVR